ncbi:MAG: glycosyltransferase family 2 protein [Parvularculaceae bacterium]
MTKTSDPASSAPLFGALQSAGGRDGPALSVVVPMFNEAGGAAALIAEIAAALDGVAHEIIAVDDGSTDGARAALAAAAVVHPQLRVFAHGVNAGQSRAIRTGVLAARAPVIATLDGDGQNDPRDIAALYAALTRAGAPPELAMVAGERPRREDGASKRFASRFANAIRRRLLDDGAMDTGCGLKVFRRDAYLRLPYFDHQHRYLPALMRREGFAVIFEAVSHRPRRHGRSKYTNMGRLAVAFRDMLGVMWLNARARSPQTISEVQADAGCDMVKTDR